jgi:hypothetical protein
MRQRRRFLCTVLVQIGFAAVAFLKRKVYILIFFLNKRIITKSVTIIVKKLLSFLKIKSYKTFRYYVLFQNVLPQLVPLAVGTTAVRGKCYERQTQRCSYRYRL